jgi:hypothetical protein
MNAPIILKGHVDKDGHLVVELPPDAPRGAVEVRLRPLEEKAPEDMTEEELDAALEALRNDPTTFTGLGLRSDEIAHSPDVGAWAHRTDIGDSIEYVQAMREQRRNRRLNREG